VVWLEAPESAIQSVMVGWFSLMVLNELARDCWSQHLVYGFHAVRAVAGPSTACAQGG
jgi:hypothetical protein